jgi:DNA helicase IV
MEPQNKNVVLQGCAGSGKTMIMLHRLSYILYNNPMIKGKSILLLTPNDGFNDYIEKLDVQLGLENINKYSIETFYRNLLKQYLSKFEVLKQLNRTDDDPLHTLDHVYKKLYSSDVKSHYLKKQKELYDMIDHVFSDEDILQVMSILNYSKPDFRLNISVIWENFKNSFLKEIKKYFHEYKQKKDFLIHDLSVEKMIYKKSIFEKMVDRLNLTISEIDKVIMSVNPDFCFNIENNLNIMITKSIESVSSFLRAKLNSLINSKIKVGSDGLLNDIRRKVSQMNQIIEAYLFLSNHVEIEIEQKENVEKLINQVSLPDFYAYYKTLYDEVFDSEVVSFKMPKYRYQLWHQLVAALIYYGPIKLETYRFICIDEVQDLSHAEISLIKELYPDAIFNVFGDIDQKTTDKGLTSFIGLFNNQSFFTLNENYRNPFEVTVFTNNNLKKEMTPIGIASYPVEFLKLEDMNQIDKLFLSFFCNKKIDFQLTVIYSIKIHFLH